MIHFSTWGERLSSLTYFISPSILIICEVKLFQMNIFQNYRLEFVLLNGLVYAFLLGKLIASSVSGVILF